MNMGFKGCLGCCGILVAHCAGANRHACRSSTHQALGIWELIAPRVEVRCYHQRGAIDFHRRTTLRLLNRPADDFNYMGEKKERDYNHMGGGRRRRKRLLIHHHNSNQRLVSIALSNSHHRPHTQIDSSNWKPQRAQINDVHNLV